MKARVWLALQTLSFVSMATTPLWIRHDFYTASKVKGYQGLSIFSSSEGSTGPSISSEVISLDLRPEEILQPKALTFIVSSRQLRFKSQPIFSSPTIRKPASKKVTGATTWHLSKILRVSSLHKAQLESVPLLRDDAGIDGHPATSSVFVELDEGNNDFIFTYQNSLGEERRLPAVVSLKL